MKTTVDDRNHLAQELTDATAKLRLGDQFAGPIVLSHQPTSAEELRWQVLIGYGFTPAAITEAFTSPIEVKDLSNTTGGGLTYNDHIELEGVQHEAALHELCHWLWNQTGLPDLSPDGAYYLNYKRLAQETDPTYAAAAAYAKLQLYGDSQGFPGILNDPNEPDWHHAWVSPCSWTMGQFLTGSRVLPSYMLPYFTRAFTGLVLLKPYYEQ